MGSSLSCSELLERRKHPEYGENDSSYSKLVVKSLYPIFYNGDILTSGELSAVRHIWDLILDVDFPSQNNYNFYYNDHSKIRDTFKNMFMERLRDTCPNSIETFGEAHIGDMIIAIISFVLTFLDDSFALEKYFQKISKTFQRSGILVRDLGILGEALFWVLSRLFKEDYNVQASKGWIKLYSVFVRYIVPYSISLELEINEKNRSKTPHLDEDKVVDLQFSKKTLSASKMTPSMVLIQQAKETSRRRQRRLGKEYCCSSFNKPAQKVVLGDAFRSGGPVYGEIFIPKLFLTDTGRTPSSTTCRSEADSFRGHPTKFDFVNEKNFQKVTF